MEQHEIICANRMWASAFLRQKRLIYFQLLLRCGGIKSIRRVKTYSSLLPQEWQNHKLNRNTYFFPGHPKRFREKGIQYDLSLCPFKSTLSSNTGIYLLLHAKNYLTAAFRICLACLAQYYTTHTVLQTPLIKPFPLE